jgi:hypothetical protein
LLASGRNWRGEMGKGEGGGRAQREKEGKTHRAVGLMGWRKSRCRKARKNENDGRKGKEERGEEKKSVQIERGMKERVTDRSRQGQSNL